MITSMPRERTKFTKARPADQSDIDAPWRLFVGIELPEAQTVQIQGILDIVTDIDLPIRWIAANAAHLTLHFIGEVPVETAELLRLAFAQAASGIGPFSLRGDGAGAFPALNKPQIVWLGLAGQLAELRRLHRATETFLLGYDIETETREFRPHITLGRSRRPLESPETNALLTVMRSDAVRSHLANFEQPFAVESVALFRSHLSHEGSSYEIVARSQLTD
jgi:2'-5' RNA ligase